MKKRIPLKTIDVRPTRLVPCGNCTACCQGDAIFLHPECGDDPKKYQTERYEGRTILAHAENGDCIYLDREKGCTIHAARPTICREMDCRELLKKLGHDGMVEYGIGHLIIPAIRCSIAENGK